LGTNCRRLKGAILLSYTKSCTKLEYDLVADAIGYIIITASFGVEDNVDVELARDLVEAVEKCAPKFPSRRGEGKAVTMRIAQEVRKIEPFLKALASRKLGLAQHLPPHPERGAILEALIRDRLAEPTAGAREEDILTTIKTRFGVVAA
jgi:hypothetical protein